MKLTDKLDLLMDEKGINQRQLSQQVKIPYSTISNWYTDPEKAANAKAGALKKLARFFDVSLDYLADDSIEDRNYGKHRPAFNPIPVGQNHLAPILGSIRAGFGHAAVQDVVGYKPTEHENYQECFWLRVEGNSMEPRIFEGDYVLIDKEAVIDNGNIVAAIVDGEEGTVKRYEKQDNALVLKPINPDCETRVFVGKDQEEVYIVGRVVEIRAMV